MATFRATADNQTLDGTVDADDMHSYGFDNVTLNGGEGSDIVSGYGGVGGEFNGGAGDDYVSAAGEDPDAPSLELNIGGTYNGDGGNDLLYSYDTTNTIFNGGEGNDILVIGSTTNAFFNGGVGDDRISFDSLGGGLSIYASSFADGGDGNDVATFEFSIENFSLTKEGGVLVVTDGRSTGTITAVETFAFINPDGVTWDEYTFDEIPCFLPGTRIATPSGDVAIETLKPGDLVLTTEGEAKPVRWLARQTVSTRFANPQRVMPILVRAGALGTGLPMRDLYVSPDHALFLDGLLVHAEALVNGSSIVRHTAMPERFTYYHVELDDHALILAEGAPVETFIDNVTRRSFDNWQEAPEAPVAAELELPRVKSARQLSPFIRNLLAMRAKALGAIAAA